MIEFIVIVTVCTVVPRAVLVALCWMFGREPTQRSKRLRSVRRTR